MLAKSSYTSLAIATVVFISSANHDQSHVLLEYRGAVNKVVAVDSVYHMDQVRLFADAAVVTADCARAPCYKNDGFWCVVSSDLIPVQ